MAQKRSTGGTAKGRARRAPTRRRTKAGVTVDRVRELALALPGTQERPSYGTPGFRVRDKLFSRVLDDGESIVVKVTFDQREVMVASEPAIFAVTPHYQDYPWVIVRLAAVDEELLREVLTEAWRITAPPSLLAASRERR
jgi:hypothetical protein